MKKLFGACSECGKQELFMTEYNCLGMLMKTKNWIVCKNCDYAIQIDCLLYTSPSPRDRQKSRMPSSA